MKKKKLKIFDFPFVFSMVSESFWHNKGVTGGRSASVMANYFLRDICGG